MHGQQNIKKQLKLPNKSSSYLMILLYHHASILCSPEQKYYHTLEGAFLFSFSNRCPVLSVIESQLFPSHNHI